MRFDSLVRLIQSADYLSFREIALLALRARGFATPAIRDGWSDGGSDVAVYTFALQSLRFAIQISVESDWRAKLREDARKAKKTLGTSDFLYVSSQRLAEVEFQRVADELVRDGIRAQRMDSQAIASLALERNLTPSILEALGIRVPPTEAKPSGDPRQMAAYAYAFFGADANDFRTRVIERTILTLLAQSQTPIAKNELIETVLMTLQLAKGQAGLVRSAVDRLTQQQAVVSEGGGVACSLAERAKFASAFAVRVADLKTLTAQLDEHLKPSIRIQKDRSKFVDGLIEHLGSILMAQADAESGSLTGQGSRSDLQGHVRDRFQALHALLDSAGFPEGPGRAEEIKELTRIAVASSFGKQLLAGELFLSLTKLGTARFLEAAGAAGEFHILLDASVAIPMLCAKLHGTADQRFFVAAEHLSYQSQLHKVPLHVPEPYLEEAATHLLAAARDYLPIIDQDPDLRGSQNAYVAHFKLLHPAGSKKEFRRYLAGFGLTPAIEGARRGRDPLMAELSKIFRRYGIKIVAGKAPRGARKQAEEALAHAINDLKFQRENLLLKHDAEVIGKLNQLAIEQAQASVLCTWDRMHFYVHEKGAASFDVMDPAALGDMMSLALATDTETSLLGPMVVAMQLSDEEAERGAAIWDTLAYIESGNLSDAELLQQAKEFKADYLRRHPSRLDRKDILSAWTRWKQVKPEKAAGT